MIYSGNQIIDKLRVISSLDITRAVTKLKYEVATAGKTLTSADSGKVIVVKGSAASTFTLPTAIIPGFFCIFINAVNQNLTVAAGVEDTLITFNDTTADSVSFATAGEKIGALLLVFCDSAAWYAISLCKNTLTVAS